MFLDSALPEKLLGTLNASLRSAAMFQPDSIVEQCRSQLQRYCKGPTSRPLPLPFDAAVAELATIVQFNLRPRGSQTSRFEYWSKHRTSISDDSLSEYVDQVILCWVKERGRVHSLVADDNAEWKRLYEFLARSARRVSGFASSLMLEADDIAQQAYLRIRSSRYPFDIPFDWWAIKILTNLTLKEFERLERRGAPPLSLNQPVDKDPNAPPLGDLIGDEEWEQILKQIEDLDVLLPALKQLLPQRQEVIVMTYWERSKDEEIAEQLGIKPSYVRLVRHRALNDLRRILREGPGKKRKRK